jgi:hypothetical protein
MLQLFFFTNFCSETADFGTKGYWHKKNGLAELTQADIDYVNILDPYDSETNYFGAGDEPFDGYFTDGTPVAAAYHNEKITDGIAAGVGETNAEVSHFLVDPNKSGVSRNINNASTLAPI